MARILITGASGLLGINLAQETMKAHELVAVDRGKLVNAPFKILNGDLLNAGILDSVLDFCPTRMADQLRGSGGPRSL